MVLFAVACAAQNAIAPPGKSSESPWGKPTHITVTTRSPEIPQAETLAFNLWPNGDQSIVSSFSNDSSRPERRILVISERFMATENIIVECGHAIDAVDGPMLTMQLITRFLDKAYPQGPSSLAKREELNVTENYKPIRVNTISAEGGWDAPWTLRGIIERKTAGQIAYRLVVFHAAPGDANVHSIEFSGVWENSANTQPLADSFSLRGWKVYTLGVVKAQSGGSGEFAAEEQPISYATLGDLRGSSATKTTEKPERKPSIPASLGTSLQKY